MLLVWFLLSLSSSGFLMYFTLSISKIIQQSGCFVNCPSTATYHHRSQSWIKSVVKSYRTNWSTIQEKQSFVKALLEKVVYKIRNYIMINALQKQWCKYSRFVTVMLENHRSFSCSVATYIAVRIPIEMPIIPPMMNEIFFHGLRPTKNSSSEYFTNLF